MYMVFVLISVLPMLVQLVVGRATPPVQPSVDGASSSFVPPHSQPNTSAGSAVGQGTTSSPQPNETPPAAQELPPSAEHEEVSALLVRRGYPRLRLHPQPLQTNVNNRAIPGRTSTVPETACPPRRSEAESSFPPSSRIAPIEDVDEALSDKTSERSSGSEDSFFGGRILGYVAPHINPEACARSLGEVDSSSGEAIKGFLLQ